MNILLPTDFSENSKNAAAYAMQLFKDIPCNFYLLHVIPISGNQAAVKLTNSSVAEPQFDNMLNYLNEIKINEAHEFKTIIKTNFLIEAVRQQVLEKKIDLILMGTKGETNNDGIVVGKNTSDVMMKVKCPLLAISENAVYKQHKEIIFPTDYKIKYNSKMMEILLNLSSLSKASVKILELFNSEREPSAEQVANRSFLQSSFGNNIPLLNTFYASKLQDTKKIFSENKNADMIVMAAKNLNICRKLLNNHPQQKIPFINQLPLLILH